MPSDSEITQRLSLLIKRRMVELVLSTEELVEKIKADSQTNIAVSTVRNYREGTSVNSPSPRTIGLFARSLGFDKDEIGFLLGHGQGQVVQSSEYLDSEEWPCPSMIRVPSGFFMMGSRPDEADRDSFETPQHLVSVFREFALGKYPITVTEYKFFIEDSGHKMDYEKNPMYVWGKKGWAKDSSKSWSNPGYAQDGDYPVVGVSLQDAEAYCRWISNKTLQSYRLPTEAEWEYACRAGTESPFCWGSKIYPEQANYDTSFLYFGGGATTKENKLFGTVKVHEYEPNPWGFFQMHGNVWEWCVDPWNDNYVNAPQDTTAWCNGDFNRALVRGGSWLSVPSKLRSAKRDWDGRDLRGDTVGFRIVREV